MMSPAGRRKVKKRKAQAKNSGVNLTVITGIMLLAVFLGFITARFVIGPIIGYNADESEIRQESINEDNAADEEVETAGTEPADGYALQFGAFSTEEAAGELSEKLKGQGIDTEIIKSGDIFKVIGPVTGSREEALADLETVKDKEVTDVFIASFK